MGIQEAIRKSRRCNGGETSKLIKDGNCKEKEGLRTGGSRIINQPRIRKTEYKERIEEKRAFNQQTNVECNIDRIQRGPIDESRK